MLFCQSRRALCNEQSPVGASPSAGFGRVVRSVCKKPLGNVHPSYFSLY